MNGNYSMISNFGPAAGMTAQTDPLSYCLVSGLESGFNHTIGGGDSLVGPNSTQCQRFMAGYCANNWDGACEYAVNDNSTIYPNAVTNCNGANGSCIGPGIGNAATKGDILLHNTASEKYLVAMSSNCVRKYEPFDPTAAASPLISRWMPTGNACAGSSNCNASNLCVPIFDVDAKSIDTDVVMNKILAKPWVAIDILVNIYNYRSRGNRLRELANTKLGRFFASPGFQKLLN